MYWLNKELQRIIYSTREKALGMGKLDFWEESIENLYEGTVNKEPISVALNKAIISHKLPKKILTRVVKSYVLLARDVETRTREPRVPRLCCHGGAM